jgi:hypothetical protein
MALTVVALVSSSSVAQVIYANQSVKGHEHNRTVIVTIFGLQPSTDEFVLFLTSEENTIKTNVFKTKTVYSAGSDMIDIDTASFDNYGLEVSYTFPGYFIKNGDQLRVCAVALTNMQAHCEVAKITSESDPKNVIIYMQNSDR